MVLVVVVVCENDMSCCVFPHIITHQHSNFFDFQPQTKKNNQKKDLNQTNKQKAEEKERERNKEKK